jgi:hypothetical protein
MLRKRDLICKLGRVEDVDSLVYRLKLTRFFQIISYFDLAIAECMCANEFSNNRGLIP